MDSGNLKRNLGDVVHVKRGYGKNNKNSPQKNIRYDGEDYKVEIRKFDRTFDNIFTPSNLIFTNLNKSNWRNLNVLTHDNKSGKGSFSFDLKCAETGTYMVDLLYFDMNYNENKCYADIYLKTNNSDFVRQNSNTSWSGDNNNVNRHSQLFTLIKDNLYTFKYESNNNLGVVGIIIKKYDVYYGTRTNNGDLTIEEINIKLNDKVQPNEAEVKIWYNHELDDTSNISGYLFDFRDEINIYKKDINDIDLVQIFGGYITTVNVDENNLIMTINCADRLIDGENRYCLQEMVLLEGDNVNTAEYKYSVDAYKSYENRGLMLDYLTNIFELPLSNDNILKDKYLTREFNYKYNYDKNNCPIITTKNMIATKANTHLVCRNGKNRDDNNNMYDGKGDKPQTMTILDVSKTKQNILLNTSPNFFIQYGLGDAEKNNTIITGATDTANTVNTQNNISYISTTVRKFADKNSKNKGENCVKDLWKAVCKLPRSLKNGFIYTPEQVIKSGGNCASKARLLGEMLTYKGVTGIQYVHIKKNSNGHVFLRLKKFKGKSNFYVDPSSCKESDGWGNYVKYKGGTVTNNLQKISDFPTRPF